MSVRIRTGWVIAGVAAMLGPQAAAQPAEAVIAAIVVGDGYPHAAELWNLLTEALEYRDIERSFSTDSTRFYVSVDAHIVGSREVSYGARSAQIDTVEIVVEAHDRGFAPPRTFYAEAVSVEYTAVNRHDKLRASLWPLGRELARGLKRQSAVEVPVDAVPRPESQDPGCIPRPPVVRDDTSAGDVRGRRDASESAPSEVPAQQTASRPSAPIADGADVRPNSATPVESLDADASAWVSDASLAAEALSRLRAVNGGILATESGADDDDRVPAVFPLVINAIYEGEFEAVPDDQLFRHYIVSVFKGLYDFCEPNGSGIGMAAGRYGFPQVRRLERDPSSAVSDFFGGLLAFAESGGSLAAMERMSDNRIEFQREGLEDGDALAKTLKCNTLKGRVIRRRLEELVEVRQRVVPEPDNAIRYRSLMHPEWREVLVPGLPDVVADRVPTAEALADRCFVEYEAQMSESNGVPRDFTSRLRRWCTCISDEAASSLADGVLLSLARDFVETVEPLREERPELFDACTQSG